MTDLADIVTSAFWRVNPPDADPQETREWLDAFDALVELIATASAEGTKLELRGGYRMLQMDFDGDDLVLDATLQGYVVGASWMF